MMIDLDELNSQEANALLYAVAKGIEGLNDSIEFATAEGMSEKMIRELKGHRDFLRALDLQVRKRKRRALGLEER